MKLSEQAKHLCEDTVAHKTLESGKVATIRNDIDSTGKLYYEVHVDGEFGSRYKSYNKDQAILALSELSEAVSEDALEFIADMLHNSEDSSDSELVDFIIDELSGSVKKSQLELLIKKERSNFLGPKYSNNKLDDDKAIIKKYIK